MFLESVPYEHRIIAQNREWGSANRPNIVSQDDAGFATLTIVRMLQCRILFVLLTKKGAH
jgi:hypothetical protein